MHSLIHAITLDPSKCVGCTNCIKKCPTEAIRVKNGQSYIIKERCINCGQCIQVCPRRARSAITDNLESIYKYPYRIALVDPVLYGQFHDNILPAQILNIIKELGFHDTFEISVAADLITDFTKEYIYKKDIKHPIISSSCPTIVRLIQIRYPSLIDHILPIDSPVEIAAYMARKKAMKSLGLNEEDIGVFYISPCPARVFSFQKPVGIRKSRISGTLSIKNIFLEISKNLQCVDKESNNFYPSGRGIGWARAGGQSQSLGIKEYLAVDGIENVISVLEEIEYQKINDLLFVECLACTNGCVGGSLTVENSFVTRNRIRRLAEAHYDFIASDFSVSSEQFMFTERILPIHVTSLDRDITKAIQKMEQIEHVLSTLPNIDCGACGSPCCRALAEDIVQGYAKKEDCIVIMKNQFKNRDQTEKI